MKIEIAFVAIIASSACALVACADDPSPAAARDREEEMKSSVSFRNDVVPIFVASCSFTSCHGIRSHGLFLPKDPAEMHAELVGKASTARPSARYVVPNEPKESWLLSKLTGELRDPSCSNGACGDRMPKGGDPLPPASIDIIEKWIAGGAKDD